MLQIVHGPCERCGSREKVITQTFEILVALSAGPVFYRSVLFHIAGAPLQLMPGWDCRSFSLTFLVTPGYSKTEGKTKYIS